MGGHSARLVLLLGLGLAPGCFFGDDSGGTGQPIPPDAAPEPLTDLDLTGAYATEESWDLSDPLDSYPELGDAVADLVIDIIVAQLGLPDSLDAAGELVLDAALGGAISDFVNGTFPTELGPGGGFLGDLRDSLRALEVETTFTLTEDDQRPPGAADNPNFFTGISTITALRARHGDTAIDVPVSEPTPARSYATVLIATRVVVGAQHRLPYGDLIASISGELLGVSDVPAYAAETAAALDCSGLADTIADIEATIEDYGVATDEVRMWLDDASAVVLAGCADLENQVGELVVPLLGTTLHAQRGVVSPLVDADVDGRIDTFTPESDSAATVTFFVEDVSTNSRYTDVDYSCTRVDP